LSGDKPKLIYVKSPAPEREPRLQKLLDRIRRDDRVSYKGFRTARELSRLLGGDLTLLLTERFEAAQSTVGSDGKSQSAPVRPRSIVPVASTTIVGRDREIMEVSRLLQSPGTRLVTLTGTGGIGKTRLALELASVIEEHFSDGVVYVPLAPLDDPTLVVPTIAQVLGLREAGDRSLDEILHDSLLDRKMLLVLDNFERVLGASGNVADLLAATSELVILVTSRAPLRIRGEQEYPLDPLALPDPSRPRAAEAGVESPAVQLFVARAQAARASFKLTERNRAAVEEICRRLDGLPLAIELAAARSRLLTPDVLLARLGNALSMLSAGARDLPERQQTMRSTLAWSYNLLTPSEQMLFRRLGVFAGGWTLDAGEAVASVGANEGADILGLLEGLIEQSLVTNVSGTDARYRFLEPIREYARELLDESGEGETLRNRHAEVFLELAEAAEPELRGPNQAARLERLEAEHDNFRVALEWLMVQSEREAVLRLAGALGRFWWMRSHFREGREWLARALSIDAGGSDLVRAKALHEAGGLAIYQGDYGAALSMLEESVTLSDRSEDHPGVALSTCYLGFAALFSGEFERAEAHFRDSLYRSRRHGYEYGVAFTLLGVGLLASFRDDYHSARSAYEESLSLHVKLADAWGASAVRNDLGWLDLEEGEAERATERFREGLRRYHELGDRAQIADTLDGMAAAAAERGQGERAVRLWSAIDAVRGRLVAPRSRPDAEDRERRLRHLRSGMDADRFGQLWEEGRRLTFDQAIALALQETATVEGQ
jgi:predicted ATPase